MRTKLREILNRGLVAVSIIAMPIVASADFNRNTDLIALHYDHAPDKDDGHATVAGRAATAFYGIEPLVVSGAYGTNASRYNANAEKVMRATWGAGWLDAHDNWARAVDDATNSWLATIRSGGDVWIAEGGQSDFTADVVRAIKSVSNVDTTNRIHLIQHSDWNEDHTTPADLSYVKSNTDYQKIEDGNRVNRTADLNQKDSGFVTAALKSAYQEGWKAAFDYLDPSSDKLDFSDTVELLHILGVGKSQVADPSDFADLFFADASNGPSSAQPWSDSYSVDGQCYCDTNFDHGLRAVMVNVPDGSVQSVPQICAKIKSQYGSGRANGRVYFNTVQCGHEPVNSASDEKVCPGVPAGTGNYTGPR